MRTVDDGAPIVDRVEPAEIARQRLSGWPDFHPETYCHECGRRNPSWFSPEWVEVIGSAGGVRCPTCFALKADPCIWVLRRWHPADGEQAERLARLLVSVTGAEDAEAQRVARCVIDAGWMRDRGEG